MKPSAVIAAIVAGPAQISPPRGGCVRAPTIATKIAAPTAMAAWRIILFAPEPVANDDAGKAEVPTASRVGKVRPTPIPVGTAQHHDRAVRRRPKAQSVAVETGYEEADAGRNHARRSEFPQQAAAEQQRRDRHQRRAGHDRKAGLKSRPVPR